MVAKLYYDDKSTACRAVLLTLRALELQLELQEVDLLNEEHLTQEFLKINPQRTIPTLVDDDLVICDSHAITSYLAAKYGQNGNLYPCDPRGKAIVDEKLYFNSNVLLPRLKNILFPIRMLGEKEISKSKLDALKEGYELLDRFLESNVFLTGKSLTIADFSCVASVSSASIILPVSGEIYPNLFRWYQKLKALPYYDEANGVGLGKLDALIEGKLGSASTKRIV